jgi:hypothetical protein
MPSESPSGKAPSSRDISLVIALWFLGIAALGEIAFAAVGLAPMVASNLRKSAPSAIPAESASATAPAVQPAAVAQPSPDHPAIPSGEPLPPSGKSSPLPAVEKPSTANSSENPSTDGSVMQILSCRMEGSDDGSKTLQLAIKARSKTQVDVPQVKVQVFFYDEQGGEIFPSKAQVTSRWISTPVDWADGQPELLEVRYLSDGGDPGIRFAGYVVAIYYRGDLQDCRAEPARLRKLFEPKYFIGLDEP